MVCLWKKKLKKPDYNIVFKDWDFLKIMKKYLLICKGNIHRSPFAAKWFSWYCWSRGVEAKVDSAGLYIHSGYPKGRKQLTIEMLREAERVFVMEEHMVKEALAIFPEVKEKITNLGIPDIFTMKSKDPDVVDNYSCQEALEYIQHNFRLEGEDFIIGPKLFRKVLEAKLSEYV